MQGRRGRKPRPKIFRNAFSRDEAFCSPMGHAYSNHSACGRWAMIFASSSRSQSFYVNLWNLFPIQTSFKSRQRASGYSRRASGYRLSILEYLRIPSEHRRVSSEYRRKLRPNSVGIALVACGGVGANKLVNNPPPQTLSHAIHTIPDVIRWGSSAIRRYPDAIHREIPGRG